ncbi:Predicted enzyme related to lactoylglutathione lyase [Leminorella richardii]|uniref:Predicted enzyme related to lactoylglutathione lyase n=1 Tax=Leminorella richardii TaxID=158841 RepID=A0A2X4V0H5_9GAMM|nr:VOC family protein [Leminorella richardii]SQI44129.1 Predicted enzyme related to lactoylglutathione lyase [Leminorella richardii]
MQFAYTILYVDDVPQMMDFYHRAFGFEIHFLHDSKDWGELATGATKLSFCSRKLLAQTGTKAGKSDHRQPIFEIAFTTDDVPAAFKRAIDAGAILVEDVKEMDWGQTISYVADPENNLVEICSAVA